MEFSLALPMKFIIAEGSRAYSSYSLYQKWLHFR